MLTLIFAQGEPASGIIDTAQRHKAVREEIVRRAQAYKQEDISPKDLLTLKPSPMSGEVNCEAAEMMGTFGQSSTGPTTAQLSIVNAWCNYFVRYGVGTSTDEVSLRLGLFAVKAHASDAQVRLNWVVSHILSFLSQQPKAFHGLMFVLKRAIEINDESLFFACAKKLMDVEVVACEPSDYFEREFLPERIRHCLARRAFDKKFSLRAAHLLKMAEIPVYRLCSMDEIAAHELGISLHPNAALWATPASAFASMAKCFELASILYRQENTARGSRPAQERRIYASILQQLPSTAVVMANETLRAASRKAAEPLFDHSFTFIGPEVALGEAGGDTYSELSLNEYKPFVDRWLPSFTKTFELHGLIHRPTNSLESRSLAEATAEMLQFLLKIRSAASDGPERGRCAQEFEAAWDGLRLAIEGTLGIVDEEIAAGKAGFAWLGPVALVMPKGQFGIGSLQYLAATHNEEGLTKLLQADKDASFIDFAQAFALALSYRRSKMPDVRCIGQKLVSSLEAHLPNSGCLAAALLMSLRYGEEASTQTLLHTAEARKWNFATIRGAGIGQLVHLAARAEKGPARATFNLFSAPESLESAMACVNESGDSIYHVAAQRSDLAFNLLADLGKRQGFDGTQLGTLLNGAGLTPVEEAALAGNASQLQLMWRNRERWQLDDALASALCRAAVAGQLAGIVALLGSAPFDKARAKWCASLPQKLVSGGDTQVATLLQAAARAVEQLMATPTRGEPTFAVRAGLSAAADDDSDNEEQVLLEALVALRSQSLRVEASLAKSPSAALGPVAVAAAPAQEIQLLVTQIRRCKGGKELQHLVAEMARSLETASALPQHEDVSRAINQSCWRVIAWLETRYYGAYFGRHFYAHRPEVSDANLQERMGRLSRTGASRFDAHHGAGILLLRSRALHLLAAQDRAPGRYAINVQVPSLGGCGFTSKSGAEVIRFCGSSLGRVIFEVKAKKEPELISMYPLPENTVLPSRIGRVCEVA